MSTQEVVLDDGPAEKTKKYDRQLSPFGYFFLPKGSGSAVNINTIEQLLWGDHGQAALESAKVCLINATATGTEILKNLILPGVGSFTIVDGNKITGDDIGNNFFLDIGSIRKSRAQVATEFLLELNDDVSGDFMEENIETLLDNNQVFFNNFSVVIATDLHERTLLRLATLLWEYDVPLMVCRSYGFVGYMRLAIKDHTIIESHPDNSIEDLRLDDPFPTLVSFCDSLDLAAMNKKDHSHTPWLVLIYKYLQAWKQDHNGECPKNFREKTKFKEYIRNGIRRNDEGVPEDEENFEEAMTHVNTALVSASIPSEVQKIFNDTRCTDLDAESSSFWIMARAVKDFVQNEGRGRLPLRGSIPDMTADSERYIQLQNVYKQEAEQHVTSVTKQIQALLQKLGKDEPRKKRTCRSPSSSPRKAQNLITESDIRMFCRNAHFLRLQSGRPLAQEYNPETANTADLGMHLEEGDSDAVFYVLLRATDKFHSEFARYPGTMDDNLESDISKLKFCVAKQMQEWNLTQHIKDDFIHEVCRYGASELHCVAAYIGGVAAQEVIKVITGQFVPVNNTYIYNAIKQSSVTLTL